MPEVIAFTSRAVDNKCAAKAAWPPLARVLFRFSFVYLILSGCYWIFQFADKATAFLGKPYSALWRPFVLWTAAHILHRSGAVEPTFVRDTYYLYALLLCFLVFSTVAALIWSGMDWSWMNRRRKEYVQLNDWLRVFLRYVLAYLLLHYGLDKIFVIQFPAPSLARLTERLGDYSPSSLMWAFIGSSTVYTIFGGLAEVLGAVLLLFRRTTTLGALVAFAVMFNVTVMDFSYDVGVKLLCLNILLMASYLVLPDVTRLLNVFFLNRPTAAVRLEPVSLKPRLRTIAIAVKICVVILLIVPLTVREWKSYRQIGPGAAHPPLYGLYDVQDFSVNGETHPPLLTDTARWRYVIFETPNTLTIRRMDDSLVNYRIRFDSAPQHIDVDAAGDVADKSSMDIVQTNSDEMTMQGTFASAPLVVKLKRVDRSSFTLVNRGFHWISESSFVR